LNGDLGRWDVKLLPYPTPKIKLKKKITKKKNYSSLPHPKINENKRTKTKIAQFVKLTPKFPFSIASCVTMSE
jgi:hypothetical protein